MQIEVGQYWETEDGGKRRIIACGVASTHPYLVEVTDGPDRGRTYRVTEEGMVHPQKGNSTDDLHVRIAAEPPPLKVGQRWKTRDGSEAEVVRFTRISDFPFTIRVSPALGEVVLHQVTKKGKVFVRSADHKYDLVEPLGETSAYDEFAEELGVEIGQRWTTRHGGLVEIIAHTPENKTYPFLVKGVSGHTVEYAVTAFGRIDPNNRNPADLSNLQPQPAPTAPANTFEEILTRKELGRYCLGKAFFQLHRALASEGKDLDAIRQAQTELSRSVAYLE